MCAFVVLGLVFPYEGKRLILGTSLKWPSLCGVGHKTLTQSITINSILCKCVLICTPFSDEFHFVILTAVLRTMKQS